MSSMWLSIRNPLPGMVIGDKKEGHGFRLCDSPVARISRRSNSVEFVSERGTHAARGLLRLLPPAGRRALRALLPDALPPGAVPLPSLEWRPAVHRRPESRSGCDGRAERRRAPDSAWPQARRCRPGSRCFRSLIRSFLFSMAPTWRWAPDGYNISGVRRAQGFLPPVLTEISLNGAPESAQPIFDLRF